VRGTALLKVTLILLFFCVAMPLFGVSGSQTSSQKSYNELYEQVFGHPPQIEYQLLTIHCQIDQGIEGQLQASVPSFGETLLIKNEDFIPLIAQILTSDALEDLKSLVDNDGNISTQGLRNQGYTLRYDRTSLVLVITTPVKYRSTKSISLVQQSKPYVTIEKPSAISGYLNIFSTQRFEEMNPSFPLEANFESVLNVQGWVARSAVLGGSPTQKPLIQSVQLIRDLPDKDLRFIVGDLEYPVIGFQRYLPLTGAGVSVGNLLPDHIVSNNLSQYKLTLTTPSDIEIWVNDKLTVTKSLPEGTYDLRNFPLEFGYNHVVIHVIDSSGIFEAYTFPFVQDQSLIQKGKMEFSYNTGVPLTLDFFSGSRKYGSDLGYSVYLRHGLNHNWTLGGYTQGLSQQNLTGIENLYATSLGLIRIDLGLSTISGQKNAIAWETSFLSFQAKHPTDFFQRWGTGLNSREKSFGALGQTSPSNPNALSGFAFAQIRLTEKLVGDLQAHSELTGFPQQENGYGFSVTFYYRHAQSILIKSWTEWNKEPGDFSNFVTGIGFSWTPGHHKFDYQRESDKNEFVNINLYPEFAKGLNVGAFARRDEKTVNTEARLAYDFGDLTDFRMVTRHRFEEGENTDTSTFTYRGNRAIIGGTLQNTSQQTGEVRVETALVFADGHFGISRPIRSNFIILHPHSSIHDYSVKFSPTGEIDMFGNAVVATSHPFRLNQVKN